MNPNIKLLPLRGVMLALACAVSSTAMAADTETPLTSKSISYTDSSQPDLSARDSMLKLAETDVTVPLSKSGYRVESGPVAAHITAAHPSLDYTLYDATTVLVSDFDHDGYYHRFSVSIDADTVYATAYVYAKLYLSFEGGPWNHYATSEAYHIYGDSVADTFIVETELDEGFPPGYYDVRIELYDADYDNWLLAYGPYDDASLSALPLEDSYRDDEYSVVDYPVETEVVVAAQGSMGGWLLLVPLVIGASRKYGRRA